MIILQVLTISILFLSGCASNKSLFHTEARGVALCRCIIRLNNQDSLNLRQKDYSLSYFNEYSNLSPSLIYQINQYVDSNMDKYISIPREIDGNMNGLTCWKFYESAELKRFIKQLYHANNKKVMIYPYEP